MSVWKLKGGFSQYAPPDDGFSSLKSSYALGIPRYTRLEVLFQQVAVHQYSPGIFMQRVSGTIHGVNQHFGHDQSLLPGIDPCPKEE